MGGLERVWGGRRYTHIYTHTQKESNGGGQFEREESWMEGVTNIKKKVRQGNVERIIMAQKVQKGRGETCKEGEKRKDLKHRGSKLWEKGRKAKDKEVYQCVCVGGCMGGGWKFKVAHAACC